MAQQFFKRPFQPRFRPPQKQLEHNINNLIKAPRVRLVGENVTVDVYSIQDAQKIADEQGLDLVEINASSDPPICRVVDYQKFLYDKKKKEKEMKSKQVKSSLKEIRFTPHTDGHDFDFKAKHAEKFLQDGNKVKAYVQFRGRAIVFKDQGELLLLNLAKRLVDFGAPEGLPKLEGKRMHMILTPKAKKK